MLPELHTERLTLREIQLEDAPALQVYQTSVEYWSCGQALQPDEFDDGAIRI